MRILACAFLIFIAAPNLASAETTEWIEAGNFQNEVRNLQRKNQLPTSIYLQSQNENAFSSTNILLRIEFKPNQKRRRWLSAFGDNISQVDQSLVAKGYTMVSLSSYLQKGNRRTKCAIWHRPPASSLILNN